MASGLLLLMILGILLWCFLQEAGESKPTVVNKILQPAQKVKAQSEASLKEQIPHLPWFYVDRIIDGDTIIIAKDFSQLTVRLDSIDCPEDGQYWGNISKFGLIKLIGGKKVHVEMHGTDPYGRTLATIYCWHTQKEDWINVNERMVMVGHAWVMRKFYDHLPDDRQAKLNRLERWARTKKIGLWHVPDPVPPWEWRCRLNSQS